MLKFNAEKHEYKHNGIVIYSVTQILEAAGLSDYSMVDPETLKAACDFGNALHKTTEFHDKGTLDYKSLDIPLFDHLRMWKLFLADYNVEILEIEKRMFNEKYRFAGTVDRIIKIGGKIAPIDIKSGCKMKSHQIQTSAYEWLYNDDRRHKLDRFTIYLKEDSYKLVKNDNLNDFNIFLSALVINNFKKAGK